MSRFAHEIIAYHIPLFLDDLFGYCLPRVGLQSTNREEEEEEEEETAGGLHRRRSTVIDEEAGISMKDLRIGVA